MPAQQPLARRTKTPKEAAEIIGIEYETVLTLIKDKRLHAIWIGNRYLIPDVALAAFLGEPVTDEPPGIRGVA